MGSWLAIWVMVYIKILSSNLCKIYDFYCCCFLVNLYMCMTCVKKLWFLCSNEKSVADAKKISLRAGWKYVPRNQWQMLKKKFTKSRMKICTYISYLWNTTTYGFHKKPRKQKVWSILWYSFMRYNVLCYQWLHLFILSNASASL